MTARYDSRKYALINRWNPRNLEIIRDWVAPVPGERVLDVGCGKGHLVRSTQRARCRRSRHRFESERR